MITVPVLAPLPYAPTITPQERRAGFVVVPIDVAPWHAIVCTLDNRRWAIKVTSPTGVSYAICDRDSLRVLDSVATLEQLLHRYPPVN